jgi:prepilin-type N-terminal cleavage/methylation domain-containing protein
MIKKVLSNNTGLTLIEILIAMAIMAALTLSTSSSLRNSTRIKKNLKNKIDRQAKFRSALRLIDRDIKLAFNHRDITFEIYSDIKKREKEILAQNTGNQTGTGQSADGGSGGDGSGSGDSGQSGAAGQQQAQQNTANLTLLNLDKYQREIPDPTQFYGEKNEIHFTNTNSIRVSAKDLNSKQQEVGYYVKNCRNRLNPELSYNCLWRRVNPIIDDRVEEGGKEFVILENVKVFKLRYFGAPKEDWVPLWFSGPRGDADTKDKFPEAVEVSIAYEENGKVEEAVMISHISFPNNPEKTEEDTASGGLQ